MVQLRPRTAFFLLIAALVWLTGQVQANPQGMLAPPDWETPPPGRLLSLGATFGADRPVIRAAPNGQLLVVFNRFTSIGGDGLPDPYYSVSNDDGQSWSTPAPLYQSSVTSLYTTFTYDSNSAAHAVWVEDLSLVYARQGDWPDITRILSSPQDIPGALHPQILSSGNSTLDVVWVEGDLSDPDPNAYIPRVRHARSTNNGNSWTESPVQPAPFNANYPSLAMGSGGKLHLVWGDTVLQAYRIYYAEGTPNGNTVSWSSPVLISDTLSEAWWPRLLVRGNSVTVTFTRRTELPGQDELQWIYKTECNGQCLNTNSWDTPSIISGQTVGVNSNDPTVLVSSMMRLGACTFVYFHGTQPPFGENELIWGVNSCDGWGALRDQVTSANTRALYPVLAATSQHIHLVYERVTSGDRQIYYMRAVPPPDIHAPIFLPFMARSQ